MSRFRKVYMAMHADEKYRRLSLPQPCGQALWWNLIAGKSTGLIPGLFSIGENAFAEQLRWPVKGFRKAFEEIESQGMAEADWEAQLIWVPKGITYNPTANPNVVKGWEHEWSELPECDLKNKAWELLKQFVEGLDKPGKDGFRVAFANACPNRYRNSFRNPLANGFGNGLPNQEQEQENKAGAGESLAKGGESSGTLSLQKTFEPKMPDVQAFARFWEIYPHKINQHLAQVKWNTFQLDPEFDPEILIAAITSQLAAGMLEVLPGSRPLHASSWIENRRWNDEIKARSPPQGNPKTRSLVLPPSTAEDFPS